MVLLKIWQWHAKPFLSRLVEVVRRDLVQKHDWYLWDEMRLQWLHQTPNMIAYSNHNGVVEMQRGAWVLFFELVYNEPRVHAVSAIGVSHGGYAIVCMVARSFRVV
jgi:hypothetical protein